MVFNKKQVLENYKNLIEIMGELNYQSDCGQSYEEMYDDGYLEWLENLCVEYNIEFCKDEIDWEWCNYIQNKEFELEKKLETILNLR